MASLAQLQADVLAWLNRRDITDRIAGWVQMTETDISMTLRARPMVQRATQQIDAAYISLPTNFCAMESIRDPITGKLLDLEDDFSGPLFGNGTEPVRAYRLTGDCIEFLPHPAIPDPPVLDWQPQSVSMVWYAAPKPLLEPQDTNPVLERLYAVYLFGVCRYGAMYELDTDRAAQMGNAFGDVVTAANNWKVAADYSGAPLRAVLSRSTAF